MPALAQRISGCSSRVFEPQRLAERRALGAQPAEIGGMLGIAGDRRPAAAVRRREHAAADPAIGACGFARRGISVCASSCRKLLRRLRGAANARPKIRSSRIGGDAGERIRSRYQGPSVVSPNSTAPASRPSGLRACCRCRARHRGAGSARSRRRRESAGRIDLDAGDLEIGRDRAATDMLASPTRCRQHPRLLVGRFDQAVDRCHDARRIRRSQRYRSAGREMIVDHNAAVDLDPGGGASSVFGLDADSDDDRSARRTRPSFRATPSMALSPTNFARVSR